jgi:mono/diheme cytochrome c family protein
MKKIFSISLFSGLVIFAIQSCGGNEGKPTIDSAAVMNNADSAMKSRVTSSVEAGVLYQKNCSMCHGDDGKAGTMGAADLSTSTINHATVVATIKNGKNAMKAFSPELSDEQIEGIASYVELLRP